MRFWKNILSCVVIMVLPILSYGQDIHFSQANTNPLFLNPALAGTMNTQYRAIIIHRGQWNSITNAYKTIAASIDYGRRFSFFPTEKIGGGILVLSDRAGDGNYGQTSIFVPLSLQHSFFGKKLFLSVGVKAGIGQFSFNFNKLYWGSQFNGNYYDPVLPADEAFSNKSYDYFDLSSGIYLSWSVNDNLKLSGSWAINHINKPAISFSGNSSERILPVNIGFVSAIIPLSPNFVLHPAIYFQYQEKNKEILPGAQLQVISGNLILQDFRAGIFIRSNDAIILRSTLVYKELQIGMSYDFTFSDFTVANNGLGGFELSLTYLFNLRKTIPAYPPKYCPDFI